MAFSFTYLIKGNKVATVTNVLSITEADEIIFDGSVYRDTIDSPFLGRDINSVVIAADSASGSGLNSVTPNTTRPVISGTIVVPDVTITQIPDPPFEESDEYNHIPPHPLEKTMTYIKFWDAAGGTGNELARVSIDQFITFTTGTIKRL
jgi:hypothetical protein